MKVLKFGGTSVGTPDNLRKVKDILAAGQPEKTVCVVSALGGVTNLLHACSDLAAVGDESYEASLAQIEARHLDTIKELIPVKSQSVTFSKIRILLNDLEDIMKGIYLIRELSPKTLDKVLSFGEILSSNIIVDFLNAEGLKTDLGDSRVLIKTDNIHNNANVDFASTNKNITDYIPTAANLVVCPGFVSSNAEGVTTTLGRGGSDYTAAIFAAALDADSFEIWTDVSGMMTSDPRQVAAAHPIEKLSFQEALELSHFGAKVIYPPTIQPVLDKKIPIKIKNTFAPEDAGTTICEDANGDKQFVKGLSSVSDIALLNLTGSGMVGVPKFSFRLFKALSEAKVNVIIITQASSEHSICVGIDKKDIEISQAAIAEEFQLELSLRKIDPLEVETGMAIVALVGDKMREHVGIGGQMFSALGENGISIKAIAQGSSERNITVVLEEKHLSKALNVLHESFFLSQRKRMNLFMIGIGNVGGTFIEQIKKQYNYLDEFENVDLRIVGIANSRQMLFDIDGIDLADWKGQLESKGEKMAPQVFVDKMVESNLRNSIFVDNTANAEIAGLYEGILRKSISVVTPNKIACASDYDTYVNLKSTAREYQAKFYYETNVGAGLPVLTTLGDLIKSGDKIQKIQAVLSGSLNFIFNSFKPGVKFVDVVKQAGVEGYTEPDPKIDLSGVDVMRKILILIRESGLKFELDDIVSESFIPAACMDTKTNEEFYASLEQHDEVFQKLVSDAEAKNCRLKVVATFDKGKASVGLQEIPKDHPFYILEGKDNIVLFYTNRYQDQPLVIKGAGAGAEVTASGIFADVMRIANS
ncbi:bifunctional aspartate kinase/homoserine dehydrogenase I [Gilvimarinus agarilyticus]|uniref:bifunctional aspartate kinase/homoserine dehydrogenase I n=1 Tax=Reichenbachiella TaxID=156993 RepID=UPI000C15938E|nr:MULTISPECIES: bifunctional aspartate kinase/homoserine dehydrogenase I [Reichenbachiella]MBU2884171.1 bifunctional aspartate kinase/homoserine dehydrogenase I [Gilvimarinus agarilyticus]MBU2912805.1 bifunctional aspartate kinase/homoserine dehydrogenase I [Reichenbachiella agariperforans]PIB34139.1 bifunctional aspartate kinase/homoserine dehydrogenase I [Reichenbachiella sp. 5M10]